MGTFYVYIMSSQKNGTLYVGVTADLLSRVRQHKQDTLDGFTKRYSVHSLVYYDQPNQPCRYRPQFQRK